MGKPKELEGRTCVVTGAARSIGLAIAEAYKAEGARVAMIDINPAVLAEAQRMGGGTKGYVLDITDPANSKLLYGFAWLDQPDEVGLYLSYDPTNVAQLIAVTEKAVVDVPRLVVH